MLPKGRRLAIDYGDARVGVAISDLAAILASPYMTLSNKEAISKLINLIHEDEIKVVYLGLPLNLSGASSESAAKAMEFGRQLKSELAGEVVIHLVDERLSTRSAAAKVSKVGGDIGKGRIDQISAAEILEFALQIEKSKGKLAGDELSI